MKKTASTTSRVRSKKSQKVDYYPNRVPFLIAVLSVIILLICGLLATYNS